ncbi:hypothetical protein SDC64_01135 [Acinetobacter haemolyticus]|uniref:hypothetical protein n=1 Tax=Acinetobacter haemolyticus TaxID=29430 RepID=UPI002A6A8749|nr:hypothetical protein [Acinetobacter haemolyticus]WPO67582.1 hypothetical protein SDC64_01135 [Acinetobacter haemolyticus]
MRQKEKKQTVLAYVLIFVTVFGYFMWFLAECDNKLLRKEILTIKYKALSEVTVGDLHAYSND